LKCLQPRISIIGMSIAPTAACLVRMMEAGANGFILKTISSESLSDAIQTVASKKTYFCEQVREYGGSNFQKQSVINDFPIQSERIREMLFLICQELTSKEIGDKLQISEKTVEKYRKQLLAVTGSKNVVGLAVYAIQQNIMHDVSLQHKFASVNNRRYANRD
jgi:DNA-binding NarL/FixJ family response regulator